MSVLNASHCSKCRTEAVCTLPGGLRRASFPCFRCSGLMTARHDPSVVAELPEPIRNRMSVLDDNFRADIERRLSGTPATVAAPLTPLGHSWPRGVLESQLRQLLASQPCKRDYFRREQFRVAGFTTLFNTWSESEGATGNHLHFHQNAFGDFLSTGRTVPAVLNHDTRKTIPGKLMLQSLPPYGLGTIFVPDITTSLGLDFAHLVQSGVVRNMSILAHTLTSKVHQLENGARGLEVYKSAIGEVTFTKAGAFSSTVVLAAGHLPRKRFGDSQWDQDRRRALVAR